MLDGDNRPKASILSQVMAPRPLVLRFVCFLSLSIWVGGFTFYSAVVIPVLHESLGSLETGLITQRVTDRINAAGGVTVALWWLAAWVDRSDERSRARRTRLGLLAATTVLLLGLVCLHNLMDGRLDSGSLRGFYPLHRIYLIISTVQWFANLGLMAGATTLPVVAVRATRRTQGPGQVADDRDR